MDMVDISTEAPVLCRRAEYLIEAGRIGAARPLLAAATRLLPEGSAELSLLIARASWSAGHLRRSLEELNGAIAKAPGHAGLRKCRSALHHQMGDLDGAARDAAEAVIVNRADSEAKALLGRIIFELGRSAEAVACLSEALDAAPAEMSYREALAIMLESAGDPDHALRVLLEGIRLDPTNVALRNAAMLACLRRRDFAGAIRLAEQARSVGAANACSFGMKGHALASLGEQEEATLAYQDALKLGPNDPYVRHLAMAPGYLPNSKRTSAEHIKTVFDGYADRFETHIFSLGYVATFRIRQALETHPKVVAKLPIGPVLDLGCGTGLVALAIADLPLGRITGVDLSHRMLDQAQAKRLYVELRKADIMTDLTRHSAERWPVIIAADVLVYFGALEELMAAVLARLEPGGWFVFTVESLLHDQDGVVSDTGSWSLHRLGRYAHSTDYVYECLSNAGFRVLRVGRQPMRQEAGFGVPGMLIVAEQLHQHIGSPMGIYHG